MIDKETLSDYEKTCHLLVIRKIEVAKLVVRHAASRAGSYDDAVDALSLR